LILGKVINGSKMDSLSEYSLASATFPQTKKSRYKWDDLELGGLLTNFCSSFIASLIVSKHVVKHEGTRAQV
jgi:hypothetical protein